MDYCRLAAKHDHTAGINLYLQVVTDLSMITMVEIARRTTPQFLVQQAAANHECTQLRMRICIQESTHTCRHCIHVFFEGLGSRFKNGQEVLRLNLYTRLIFEVTAPMQLLH